ncbi:Hypothetical protein PBC10988_16790 [Planctomycetales bacterium 10988]|nr:Hypothetical protein PBC10988_16790 [Planctomycetales bacterium 10988]
MFGKWLSSSDKNQSREQIQDTPLHLESLEPRVVLNADPYLVADINKFGFGISEGPISYARPLEELNGEVYFTVFNQSSGAELWKSDGTTSGTQLVKDIAPGPTSSYPLGQYFIGASAELNGELFFSAFTESEGFELWKTDGTEAGTQLVKDIAAGTDSGYPIGIQNINGTLYFFSPDPDSFGPPQLDLWKSDGTSSGTVLIKDFDGFGFGFYYSFSYLEELDLFEEVNGTVYFAANDGTYGTELWKTDGTSAGTELVVDLAEGSDSSYPGEMTNVNGTLFFTAGAFDVPFGDRYLYKTDGTSAGTEEIFAAGPPDFYDPFALTNLEGTLFFAADLIDGGGEALWQTDGYSIGTFIVKDFDGSSDYDEVFFMRNVSGTLFMAVYTDSLGAELWKSDGTSAGTVLVKDLDPGSDDGYGYGSYPLFFGNSSLDGTLYFAANDGTYGYEVWRTDGTSGGTVLVKDIQPGIPSSYPFPFVNASGEIFFFAAQQSVGYQLWKTNGYSAGTVPLVKTGYGTHDSDPDQLFNMNGTLFFLAEDGINGEQLWTSDGTCEGTQLVKVIVPPDEYGYAYYDTILGATFTDLNGTLFFFVDDPEDGLELWKSDGTSAGTVLVKETGDTGYPGEGDGEISSFTNVNGTLYFIAWTDSYGVELWKSDGTTAGTNFLADINPGSDGSYPYSLVNVNGTLFFAADNDTYGNELWMSDGTSAGTVLVKDSIPGEDGIYPYYLTNVNGTLFFSGVDPNFGFGYGIWMSDGSSAGTVFVENPYPGGEGYPEQLTNINGTLFFVADDGSYGYELWRSDGTSAGTYMVADIDPGSGSSDIYGLTEANGSVFFRANDGSTGRELWVSDGTSAGTHLVKDLDPDGGGITSDEEDVEIINVNGIIYFAADNDDEESGYGRELWKTDGTSEGTVLVANINSSLVGAEGGFGFDRGSYPDDIVNVNGTLFFEAFTPWAGEELWAFVPTEETPLIVTGTDAGEAGTVRVFDPSGEELMSFFPFTEEFTGGVRVATGDINGDGILDIVMAAGPGGGPRVRVFDSQTGEPITGGINDFYAYDEFFSGGVFIAVADVNGDGFDDIITGAGATETGESHVRIFSGEDGSIIREFYAYELTFHGGVHVAAGDINNDGFAEVITGPGAGRAPTVRVFDGNNTLGSPLEGAATNFDAYDSNFLGGVFVASGDFNDDGFWDIVTGAGATGGPHVKVIDSTDGTLIQNFFAYDPSFTGGVRVGAADLNLDGIADILTVPGSPGGPHTRAFDGTDLSDISNFFSGSPTDFNGLFVAGGISLVPSGITEVVEPLSALFVTENTDPPEDTNPEDLEKKSSRWSDDVEEFYQSAEEIDKLFSDLGLG